MHDTFEAEGTTSSRTSGVLQATMSGSTDSFLSGDTPPPKLSVHSAGLEAGDPSAEVVEEGDSVEEAGKAEEAPETKPVSEEIPPSPLLSRPVSYEHSHETPNETLPSTVEGEANPIEVDLAEWHPLDHTRSESKDINQTQDTTFVDDSVAYESNEKHGLTPVPHKQMSHSSLRIVTKTPSPQPWDLVEPPPSHNGDTTDYYSTLGTKNFGTLQKNRYVWAQFVE
jgi:hypothetical protein